LGIIALIAILVVLYYKSGTFRDLIRSIGDVFVAVFHVIKGGLEWIIDKILWVIHHLEEIPGVKQAIEVGSFLAGGSSGPPIHFTGANPIGTSAIAHAGSIAGDGPLHVHVHTHVDRKVLGEAVAKFNADQASKK
jgi:hypothetical protein